MSMVRKVTLNPLLTPLGEDKMETERNTSPDGHHDVFAVLSPAGIVALCCFAPEGGPEEGLEAPVVAPMPIRGGSCLSPDKRLIPYGEDTRYFWQHAPAAARVRSVVPVR